MLSGMFSGGISILVFFILMTLEFLGRKRHHSIVKSRGFRALIQEGFQIKRVNEYSGITGIFEGYVFDIYFDWDTPIMTFSDKAFIFNVYFMPPLNEKGYINNSLLDSLAKKYDQGRFSYFNYWWRPETVIMKNKVGFLNPTRNKLKKRMALVVSILQCERLKPLDRYVLEDLKKKYPNQYGPEIECYQDKN
jgi:hypothetical protein